MNFKTTYILFALLAGVLGVLAVTLWVGPSSTSDSDYALPSMHDARNPVQSADIDTVEIERFKPRHETLVFVRDKATKTWRMTRPYSLRVDTWSVDRLIGQVMDARKAKNADVRADSDLKTWGLDEPTMTVTVKQGGEREWKLNLGNERAGKTTGVVYVNSSDRPKEPMAVARTELEVAFKGIDEFRSKDLLRDTAQANGVTFQQKGGQKVVLDKTGDEEWRFVEPSYGRADAGKVRDLLLAASSVRADSDADFGPPEASDEELKKFGLEQGSPTFLSFEMRRPAPAGKDEDKKEPVQDTLLVGNLVETDAKAAKEDKKDEYRGEKRYARLGAEKAVVKVTVKSVEPLTKAAAAPDTLRNRNLVEGRGTDAINLQNATGLIKLRKPTTWKMYAEGKPPRSADDQAVQDLINSLTKKDLVSEFPDPSKEGEFGFDKPQAVVSLWFDGIQKEEPKSDKADEKKDKPEEKKDAEAEPKLKTDKPSVQLTFGKEDKDVVYVRREVGSEKTLLGVPKSVLGKLTQGPVAFLDRVLPSFSTVADIASVTLDRGGETWEVEKEGSGWKLKKPDYLAGKTADTANVEGILRQLRELRAERLVAEGTGDLEKYGLQAPQVRATVRLKPAKEGDKPDEWIYSFGKETEDKGGVYALQNKRDVIFVVRPEVLTALRGELQDLTVLHFDASKVKELKLAGWKSVVGSTFTLEVEQKAPRTWVMKAPADFDLDSGQADLFLNLLANLKAEKFVVRQGGPKPEYKLGPKDAALQIQVTVEGEKEPLTLTIGDLDAKEKAYYAQSSTLKDMVFLVRQDQFEKVLSGPKYFSKRTEAAK